MLAIIKKSPAANPQERMQGNRPVAVLLICIGFMAMFAVMYMTGRFGWSLQDDPSDRIASAVIHVLVDGAAASLIMASGIMFKWRELSWKAMALLALFCALILVAYSIITVYGFMSTRIAHLESHNQLIAMQTKNLDWTRSTSINRDVPKSERLFLRQETKAAREDLKKSISFVPDAAASSIASVFSTSVERVQRALVMIGSGVGQLIKFSCLFIGFTLYPHRLQGPRKPMGGPDGGGNRSTETEVKQFPKKPTVAPVAAKQLPATNVVSLNLPSLSLEDRLLRYVTEQLARGKVPVQDTACRALGESKPTISKAFKRLEAKGDVQRKRNGKFKEIRIARQIGVGGSRYATAGV